MNFCSKRSPNSLPTFNHLNSIGVAAPWQQKKKNSKNRDSVGGSTSGAERSILASLSLSHSLSLLAREDKRGNPPRRINLRNLRQEVTCARPLPMRAGGEKPLPPAAYVRVAAADDYDDDDDVLRGEGGYTRIRELLVLLRGCISTPLHQRFNVCFWLMTRAR